MTEVTPPRRTPNGRSAVAARTTTRLRVRAEALLRRPPRILRIDPLDDPFILGLTQEFLQLRWRASTDAVDAVVKMGSILLHGRPRLRGHYERWLRRLHLTRGTAHNYTVTARLAQQEPHVLSRLRSLGPSKLYRVAHLSNAGRQRLMAANVEELERASHPRFVKLTSRYLARRRSVTPDMRAHGLRMKVQAMKRCLQAVKLGVIRRAELRNLLRADLTGLARQAAMLARAV